jgi:CheY-like chemotaxis protein
MGTNAMRILVVDDEPHLRRMMRLTLEASGYEVAEAADGEAGVELFGDGTRFDATLLDHRMPGTDGLEALRRMRLARADACIIMVTAYATIELAVDAMKVGATDFVRKPMTPDTLRHAVAAALAKRDEARRPAAVPDQTVAPSSPSATGPPSPREIWTTNGFFVRRLDEPSPTDEHHFMVRRGTDTVGTEVVVSVDPRAASRIVGDGGKALRPSGAFWRQQAESALLNHLWSEAALPEDGRLVISRATGSMQDEAMRWSED